LDRVIERIEAAPHTTQAQFTVSKILHKAAHSCVTGIKVFCKGVFVAYVSFKPKTAVLGVPDYTGISDSGTNPTDVMIMDKVAVYL
jgi:hypothetical protein